MYKETWRGGYCCCKRKKDKSWKKKIVFSFSFIALLPSFFFPWRRGKRDKGKLSAFSLFQMQQSHILKGAEESVKWVCHWRAVNDKTENNNDACM